VTSRPADAGPPADSVTAFCDDPSVDREQERQLRKWAVTLSEAEAADRKAMGRAILMLLGQIASLRAELGHASTGSPAEPEPPPTGVEQAGESAVEEMAVYDSSPIGIRSWRRAAGHRGET
jgi:hypothetical protein